MIIVKSITKTTFLQAWEDYLISKVQSRSQVEVRTNGAIDTIATKWDLIFLKNGSFLFIL